MNKVKLWVARRWFKELITDDISSTAVEDASGPRELVTGLVKRIGLRLGDLGSKDFEAPEFDLTAIYNGYNTDSYVRQGVDKYIDQVFKEGYDFYGKDTNIVSYINLRLNYMAEATGTPTGQLLIDIAEDVVKYANCIIVKARAKDATSLPPSVKVTGLNGAQPVSGYFCLNATTMKVKRDKNGTIQGWQQEVSGGDKPVKFKSEDIVHMYYKREKGNAFGTSFLIPVLDDVRALRQAEENVLRMMYRNIYPFYHLAVGEKDAPGTPGEIQEVQDTVNNMDVEGGIVTTNRVVIKPVASDQVIDAEPYLRYLEERVFSGMGVPAIMFGRGNTANRSTGDNMTSEMADRIKAIQKTIEMFINTFIIKELLMEGGFDPILNPDQLVEFRFRENDLDTKIKAETHAIYQYEHNAITEDEMRQLLGRDPITDRSKMMQMLVTQANAVHAASLSTAKADATGGTQGTKATNNKQKPTNQFGSKTSPKKVTNSAYEGLVKDNVHELREHLNSYISDCKSSKSLIQKGMVEQIVNRSLLNSCEVINCTLDIVQFDTAAIQKNTVNIYSQLKKDVHDSLIDLHDYSEALGLVNTIIDLTQVSLLDLV